jgi:hypothetical protein
VKNTTDVAVKDRERPNHNLTSGDIMETRLQTICEPGYTDRVRHVTWFTKLKVFLRYRTLWIPGRYEVDHLVPLELGGSNAITNLWPQPKKGTWTASQKDVLENKLHDLVCSNQLDLQEAQKSIAEDWIGAYQRYVGS